MNIKILCLSGESRRASGFAEQAIRKLEAQRVLRGSLHAKKVLVVGGITILLKCSQAEKKAILWGGEAYNIVFKSSDKFYLYDYIRDSLKLAKGLPSSGDLIPAYNRRMSVDALQSLVYNGALSVSELPGGSYTYLGGANAYEMAFFEGITGIFARVADHLGKVGSIVSPDALLPSLCGAHSSLFGLTVYDSSTAWNLYRGAARYALSPANASLSDVWRWVPAFFTAQPDDPYNLKPGWYYGYYPEADYDIDNPLESLKVSLLAVCDTKLSSSQQGWCEMVTAVNGVAQSDINIYLQPLAVPINSYFYHESSFVSYDSSTLTVGSDLSGAAKSFQVQASDAGTKPDAVEMWSFLAWSAEGPVNAIGLLVIEGTHCRGFRYTGFLSTFIDTSTYHSHSTSRDGALIAVFEADDGVIVRVRVFDIHGTREVASGSIYTGGGFTELRSSDKVSTATPVSGVLIPFRANGLTPIEPQFTLDGADIESTRPTDYTELMPSLSWMVFTKDASTGIVIHKVLCTNGVDAEYGKSRDDCFSSVVRVADPDKGVDQTRMVAWWDVGGVWRGVIRGEFTGTHPNVVFTGDGPADSGWYGEITLPPTFDIIANQDGTLSFEGYAGELEVGGCITTDDGGAYTVDPSCIDGCGGTYTMTASSSCGQTASREGESEEPSVLVVSANDDIQVGDFVGASGGAGDIVYTFGGGSIDSETGEILSITTCSAPGDIRYAAVGATDACGTVDTKEVRLPGGGWVYNDDSVWCKEDHYFPPGASSTECVNGGTKTRYLVSSVCWKEEDYEENAASMECSGCGVTACEPLACGVNGGCPTGYLIYYQHWKTDSYYWGCP